LANIIDGKLVASAVKTELAAMTKDLIETKGIIPGLAVVCVGDDPASQVYVKNKCRACEEIGYHSVKHMLPTTTTEQDLLLLISELNANPDIHGILVQMPLPSHINEKVIMRAIKPSKDVDAFHPENVGRIVANDYLFAPCTPAGIMTLLEYYGIDVAGKECVIVGRSDIVGKPLALLMTHANGTVTVCHSRTADLAKVCSRADILVVAIGRAKFVTADYVKPGAIVIDVGINRTADGKLCGDVDFESVAPIAAYITPVPGGVGPMTIAMLMKNTYTAATL
jgi:methylenetetrahydrofolate dehydrogenase (NADP+)/methenyltetrahydrofolate cyclohydrolase